MNCPLIMVKTFLLQDSVDLVKARNEVDDQKWAPLSTFARRSRPGLTRLPLCRPTSFFRFCMLNHSSHPPPKGPEDSLSVPPPRMVPRRAVSPSGHPGAPDDEEVELLSDYSWRNFFSAINRIKIIQKLLKGRTHQIHQFNQYKTFVRPADPSCPSLAPMLTPPSSTRPSAEHVQAHAQGPAPDVPAAGAQDHQGPDPALRQEVEAACVPLPDPGRGLSSGSPSALPPPPQKT